MKNKELYDKTVGILVDAYMNDTLIHGDCAACAVGNIIASNLGTKVIGDGFFSFWQKGHNQWNNVFITTNGYQFINKKNYFGEAKRQIDSTGYSLYDLAKIEKSFESVTSEGDFMFNGLMAVVECLDIIHENTDAAITTHSKNRFNKTACAI